MLLVQIYQVHFLYFDKLIKPHTPKGYYAENKNSSKLGLSCTFKLFILLKL